MPSPALTVELQKERDRWEPLLGSLLGRGCYREVFAYVGRPDLVIKRVHGDYSLGRAYMSNQIEYDTWCTLGNKPLGKFLTPCVDLSEHGTYLVQKRATPYSWQNHGHLADKRPFRVPKGIFTDLYSSNVGFIDNEAGTQQFVIMDYGLPDWGSLIGRRRATRAIQP